MYLLLGMCMFKYVNNEVRTIKWTEMKIAAMKVAAD